MERIYHLEDILDCIQGPYEIRGSKAAFHSAKNIDEAGEGCISWMSESRSRDATFSQTVGASVVVAHTAVLDHYRERPGQVVVATEQPRVSFAAILHKLFWERPAPGVHPTAIVHPEATIGLHVHIGAFAIIGKCCIGNDAVIHSHCVLHDRVCLGERVVIKNHTTIGSDGYGYVRLSDGRNIRFPHLGGVIIGDDVEIGANCCVDRGTLGDTVLGPGTKLDNLVHIAHNVRTGTNCMITAGTTVAGSTEFGNDCWIAPAACFRDGLHIASGVTVGLGAVVARSLEEPGIYLGNPARPKTPA
jgi:UDP-3-O-[3-hydroxymyristoyl] glucosamine N-acyltransferase